MVSYEHLEKRRTIDVWFFKYSEGRVEFQEDISSMASKIADAIKGLSDGNSCAHILLHVANLAIAYHATTSGNNCDTTAQTKTIRNAVKKTLTHIADVGATGALIDMRHGGTWTGTLAIAEVWAGSECNVAKDNSYCLQRIEREGRGKAMALI